MSMRVKWGCGNTHGHLFWSPHVEIDRLDFADVGAHAAMDA